MKLTADELFKKMCELTAQIPMGYDPGIYSIRYLAEIMSQSKYMVRKRMKELEAKGLVCKDYDGGVAEDYIFCYHGWRITKKAGETELYKRVRKEVLEEFEKFEREFDKKYEREHGKNEA